MIPKSLWIQVWFFFIELTTYTNAIATLFSQEQKQHKEKLRRYKLHTNGRLTLVYVLNIFVILLGGVLCTKDNAPFCYFK